MSQDATDVSHSNWLKNTNSNGPRGGCFTGSNDERANSEDLENQCRIMWNYDK